MTGAPSQESPHWEVWCHSHQADNKSGCIATRSLNQRSMVAGNSWRWFSVDGISRAICGTANPMKAIGPQNAVVTAVSKPVTTAASCARVSCSPRFSAYCSPNSGALGALSIPPIQLVLSAWPAQTGHLLHRHASEIADAPDHVRLRPLPLQKLRRQNGVSIYIYHDADDEQHHIVTTNGKTGRWCPWQTSHR